MQQMSSKCVACFLVVFVVGSLSFLGQAAEAQLAKSGTIKAHSGWFNAGEAKKVGVNRLYWVGVYWGVMFNDEGKGFLHRAAWNCPAVNDIVEDVISAKGNCTATDLDGDKIYGVWEGKGSVTGKFTGSIKYNGGTGKYNGIQGGHSFECQGVGPDNQIFVIRT